jgi:hypothetical protein
MGFPRQPKHQRQYRHPGSCGDTKMYKGVACGSPMSDIAAQSLLQPLRRDNFHPLSWITCSPVLFDSESLQPSVLTAAMEIYGMLGERLGPIGAPKEDSSSLPRWKKEFLQKPSISIRKGIAWVCDYCPVTHDVLSFPSNQTSASRAGFKERRLIRPVGALRQEALIDTPPCNCRYQISWLMK